MVPTEANPFIMIVTDYEGEKGKVEVSTTSRRVLRMEVKDHEDLSVVDLTTDQARDLGIALITLARKASHVPQE